MERLSRVACYFQWMRNASPRDTNEVAVEDEGKPIEVEQYRNVGCNFEASRRLCSILESVLLWENSVNSISVVIVFNILFWWVQLLWDTVRHISVITSQVIHEIRSYFVITVFLPCNGRYPLQHNFT